MTENHQNGIMEEPDKDSTVNQETMEQQQTEQNQQTTDGQYQEQFHQQAIEEPVVIEERTQADHMDKKLLCAFLDRLNQMSSEPITERLDTDENDFDDSENK